MASGRWATILKKNADGVAEIANISLMEGAAPEVNVDASDRYDFQEVDDGVKIGMVQGGKVGAVGGWGFQDELAAAGRSESGVTRIADTKPEDDEASLPAVSHEKQRADEVSSSKSESSDSDDEDKPAGKAKRQRKATGRKARAKK